MSKEANIYKKMPKKIYIRTFGCQMNEYDSEVIESNLLQRGYSFTEQPEEADIILLNGCSVREHAEQRLWGNLENLKRFKKIKPELIFGVFLKFLRNFFAKLIEIENNKFQ